MNRLAQTLALLLAVATAAAPQSKSWRGAWTATVGNGGRVLGGTWDATLGNDLDTAQGNWTIADQNGATIAQGAWAARKAKTWRGSWQARGAAGQVYSGTWRVQSLPASTDHFADMFTLALSKTVSGTWQMGSAYSGAWSIRAYPRE